MADVDFVGFEIEAHVWKTSFFDRLKLPDEIAFGSYTQDEGTYEINRPPQMK